MLQKLFLPIILLLLQTLEIFSYPSRDDKPQNVVPKSKRDVLWDNFDSTWDWDNDDWNIPLDTIPVHNINWDHGYQLHVEQIPLEHIPTYHNHGYYHGHCPYHKDPITIKKPPKVLDEKKPEKKPLNKATKKPDRKPTKRPIRKPGLVAGVTSAINNRLTAASGSVNQLVGSNIGSLQNPTVIQDFNPSRPGIQDINGVTIIQDANPLRPGIQDSTGLTVIPDSNPLRPGIQNAGVVIVDNPTGALIPDSNPLRPGIQGVGGQTIVSDTNPFEPGVQDSNGVTIIQDTNFAPGIQDTSGSTIIQENPTGSNQFFANNVNRLPYFNSINRWPLRLPVRPLAPVRTSLQNVVNSVGSAIGFGRGKIADGENVNLESVVEEKYNSENEAKIDAAEENVHLVEDNESLNAESEDVKLDEDTTS